MRVARYSIIDDITVIVNIKEKSLEIIARYAGMTPEEMKAKLEEGEDVVTGYSIYRKAS